MPSTTPYRARKRGPDRAARTREKILGAVRDLLVEGVFHDCTVEEVAERAGVSRATLYQHFNSRLELVDGVCDWLAFNPALLELRKTVESPDPDRALADTIAGSMRFWASEDTLHAQLYGVVAIDEAARDFVARQRADRSSELAKLARNLQRSGALRPGLGERRAHQQLLVLTSYETFKELQLAGLGEREATKLLQESARALMFGTDA